MIQVDICGHPPILVAQYIVFHLGNFPWFFRVLKFRGRFEALTTFFRRCWAQEIAIGFGLISVGMFTSRLDLSNGLLSAPNKDCMQKLRPREVYV
jgi:hypothetical protein